MEHVCTLAKYESLTDTMKWHVRCRMISPENPLRVKYFRSDVSVKQEQKRHLELEECSIHPFSKLRARYEMYLIYLYTSLIITKPFDSAFLKTQQSGYIAYKCYTLFTDFLGGLDIIMSFFTGYEVPKYKTTELRVKEIVKHYLFGPFFIIDVLSALNLQTAAYGTSKYRRYLRGVISILNMLKIVRLITLVKYIRKTADYFRVTSRGKLFLFCSVFVSLMIVHYMACLQFAVPRFVRREFSAIMSNDSWFFGAGDRGNIFKLNMGSQYIHCFFRSSAFILGIHLNLYAIRLPEEYLLSMFTYFVGKILLAFVWVILAVAIINSRLVNIKHKEMFNQLEEYLTQKQVPMALRKRILEFFIFKYRHKYFKEELITSLLSEDLKGQANLHLCQNLIRKVPIFSDMSEIEMSRMVNYLIKEIYLPHDTVVRAGDPATAMYFISSGTVAVYTHSGKEVCHLQDGAYFGEIPLLMRGRARLATVKAVEETLIYRLNRKAMEKFLLTNINIKEKILKLAEVRLQEMLVLEEAYKTAMIHQSIGTSSPAN